jgi:hypothetical protein
MVAQPDGFGYTIVELAIGSLYVTSVLSNLNARQYIRGRKTEWNEFLSASQTPHMNSNQSKDQDIVFARINRQTNTLVCSFFTVLAIIHRNLV